MATGKLPNELLSSILNKNITLNREEVLVGARVGLDTAILDLGDELVVLSTDPITGAAANIGSLSVIVSINDIATSGGEPVCLLLTILAPPGSTVEEIEAIHADATKEAEKHNVVVVGGHTEITDAVTRYVLSTTVIGKLPREKRQDYSKIAFGDSIYLTKDIGLEGTAILANDREGLLQPYFSDEEIDLAKSYADNLSVLKEGRAATKLGVQYLHDVTEGGIYGAVYEASQGIGKGMKIYRDKLPITPITERVCDLFHIDPLGLISSGSMLMIVPEDKRALVKGEFEAQGLKVTWIGEVIDGVSVLDEGGELRVIPAPTSDELYRALAVEEL